MFDTEDWFMLKDLAREQEQNTGRVNISELSRETGLDRKTVRRYLRSDHPLETPPPEINPANSTPTNHISRNNYSAQTERSFYNSL